MCRRQAVCARAGVHARQHTYTRTRTDVEAVSARTRVPSMSTMCTMCTQRSCVAVHACKTRAHARAARPRNRLAPTRCVDALHVRCPGTRARTPYARRVDAIGCPRVASSMSMIVRCPRCARSPTRTRARVHTQTSRQSAAMRRVDVHVQAVRAGVHARQQPVHAYAALASTDSARTPCVDVHAMQLEVHAVLLTSVDRIGSHALRRYYVHHRNVRDVDAVGAGVCTHTQ